MTTSRVRRVATVICAATAATGWWVAPAHASDDSSVPVLGQAISRGTINPQSPEVVITVHGVRRIQGGTAVYFSAGFPAGTADASTLNFALSLNDQFRKYAASGRNSAPDDLGIVAAVDQSGKKVYSACWRAATGVCARTGAYWSMPKATLRERHSSCTSSFRSCRLR